MNYKLPPLPPQSSKVFSTAVGPVKVLAYSGDDMQAYAIAAIEAQGVPDGWKLVPVEMTHDMLRAPDYRRLVAASAGETERRYAARQKDWEAILLAAPPAPQAERTLLEQYDLEQSSDYRKGWDGGRKKGYEVGVRHGKEQHLFSQASVVQQEPVASAMTAQRAAYFMERFKHEEKLLGPNEQAALDFVLSMLYTQPAQQAKPQPLSDEQLKQLLAAEYTRGWNDCEATHDGP